MFNKYDFSFVHQNGKLNLDKMPPKEPNLEKCPPVSYYVVDWHGLLNTLEFHHKGEYIAFVDKSILDWWLKWAVWEHTSVTCLDMEYDPDYTITDGLRKVATIFDIVANATEDDIDHVSSQLYFRKTEIQELISETEVPAS